MISDAATPVTSFSTVVAPGRAAVVAHQDANRAPERIRFVLRASTLGTVLIARSHAGLRAVLIGDDAGELRLELARRNPGAELAEAVEATAAEDPLVGRVLALIDAPHAAAPIGLPLDPGGTAFQQQVWDALRTLPIGTTVTYSQLAAQLGVVRGARAVARACAANPLAVVVPCHRVVRGDGALAGYRWGMDRKRRLLERERALPEPREPVV